MSEILNSTIWEMAKLSDISLNITDGKHGDCQNEIGSEYYFISAKDIYGGNIDYSNARQITKNDFIECDRRTRLQANDIVVVSTGATIGKVGIIKDIPETRRTTFQKSVAIIKPNPALVDPFYLFVTLFSMEENLRTISTGSSQKNLLLGTLRNVLFPIPPLEEQRKIAAILSTWDEAIGLAEQLIAALGRRKQALMQLLLTGAVRFAGFEGKWEEMRLGEIANINMGQSPSSEYYNEIGDGLPLVQGNADIRNRKTSPRVYSTDITKQCEIGDIILSVRAPVGEIALSLHHAIIGRGVCAIRGLKVNQKYLYQLLLSLEKKWSTYAQGSTFTAINSSDIRNILVNTPTNEIEQSKISDMLEDCDVEIEIMQDWRENLQAQKRGLMQQLLTGAVRV